MSVQEQKKQLFTLVFERMKDQSNSYFHVVLSRQFQYRKVDFFFYQVAYPRSSRFIGVF